MFADPQKNVEQFGLSDGMVIADLGAGSGYYSIEIGKAVAPTGRVYAIDVQKDLLERLQKEAKRLGVRNIEIATGDLEKLGGSRMKDSLCDGVVVSNVLFMIEDKKSFLSEIKRILKPKGRLFLIDWAASFSSMGPHPDHVVYKDDAMKMVLAAGFKFDKEIQAGEHHYGIIFRKS